MEGKESDISLLQSGLFCMYTHVISSFHVSF